MSVAAFSKTSPFSRPLIVLDKDLATFDAVVYALLLAGKDSSNLHPTPSSHKLPHNASGSDGFWV